MEMKLMLWMTTVAVQMSYCTPELPTAELISSGRYMVFVPVIPVYFVIDHRVCNILLKKSVRFSEIPRNIDELVTKLRTKNMPIGYSYSICQLYGTLQWNRNVIKLLDDEPCRFDHEFCYNTYKTLTFWDVTSTIQYQIVFSGKLNLWEVEMFQPQVKFKLLIHEKFNLALRIEGELMKNNVTFFATSIDGLFVRSISDGAIKDFVDFDATEKYFGKSTTRTKYESNNVTNADTMKENSTERKCITNSTVLLEENFGKTDAADGFNWIVVIVLVVSGIGNCIGIVCVVLYCCKHECFGIVNKIRSN